MTDLAVPRHALASAARALAHAGRWHDAAALLDAAPADPLLTLTAAQVAIESDWFAGTNSAAERLAAATRVAADLDEAGRWDLAFVALRHAYQRLLGAARSTQTDEVRRHAAELASTAPDAVRQGWAEMYQGLIADNLLAERDAAPAHYRVALAAGDALLTREALRHLGDHAHDDGGHEQALDQWRRATELGAAAGNVPGTLSQQLLLAVLARDEGDEAGAVMLGTEVARWAAAIGANDLAGRAAAFVAGADPTAPPPGKAAPTATPSTATPSTAAAPTTVASATAAPTTAASTAAASTATPPTAAAPTAAAPAAAAARVVPAAKPASTTVRTTTARTTTVPAAGATTTVPASKASTTADTAAAAATRGGRDFGGPDGDAPTRATPIASTPPAASAAVASAHATARPGRTITPPVAQPSTASAAPARAGRTPASAAPVPVTPATPPAALASASTAPAGAPPAAAPTPAPTASTAADAPVPLVSFMTAPLATTPRQ